MWRYAENDSEEKPVEIDKETSPGNVIVRKDFEQVPTLDEEGKEIGYHWLYLEKYMPKDMYDKFDQIDTNQADIAYIAMMSDIEL